jgi:hypothetical protein
MRADPRKERRWYADWRVWLCLVLLTACGLAQSILGLPFRLIDAVRNLLF